MDSQRQQPRPRKALHDEIDDLVADCDRETLARLVHRLADEWPPHERETLIARLHSALTCDTTPSTEASLQATIEGLTSAVQQRMAEAEDWPPEIECESDESELFDDLLPLVYRALAATAAALDRGEAYDARAAYESLFIILTTEDDYGRALGWHVGVEGALAEHAARYLRAVYLDHLPSQRVEAVLSAARWLGGTWIVRAPGPGDLRLSDPAPMPGWQDFLDGVIRDLDEAHDPLGDRWLREAVIERAGLQGLIALCERQGSGRPNAWLDRVRVAVEQDDASAALNGACQALALFPQHAPIHARIAAQTAPIAERLGEHETWRELRTAAFLAEPDAAHLAWLYDALPGGADSRQRHLRWTAYTLAQHRLADWRPVPRRGGKALDEPIASMAVSWAAVALAELFAGDWASARQRADACDTLGWSSPDNARPLVVAYALLALCGGDPRHLGPNAAKLWDGQRPPEPRRPGGVARRGRRRHLGRGRRHRAPRRRRSNGLRRGAIASGRG
jgi:hypothetical protein